MTLIAAYKEQGVPILIGDFLITGDANHQSTRKKIHKIHSNLVVGWTGHLLAAIDVMTSLHDRFREERPTRQTLDAFFENYPIGDLGTLSVYLAGWLYDDDPLCFWWNSQWGGSGNYDNEDFVFAGSGANKFQALAGTGGGPAAGQNFDPIKMALNNALYLTADEVGARNNLAQGFGFGYELLHLVENHFEYVNDVLYLFCEVPFDDAGRFLGPRLHPVLYRYRNENDFSVVDIVNVAQQEGGNMSGIDRLAITTVFRDPDYKGIAQRIMSPEYSIPLEAEYVCLFASLIKDANTDRARPLDPFLHISRHDPQPFSLSVSRTPVPTNPSVSVIEIKLPPQEIFERVYQAQIAEKGM